MKTVDATVHVQPGQEAQFMTAAHALIPAARAESGNARFDLYHSTDCASDFVFVEVYADQAAIIAHRDSVHFQEFLRALAPITNAPMDVMIFDGEGATN
ncbi:putative quinol monooxygenase [Furfurilactobacillus siliginis]|nr:putative quinol monooxygenase [Furfurilactobacillus siliginis]GEK28608.1 antibiotic biosynthesis monooxygenase [Furfurilactobacillus siliginis]